jgi:hypothetical protein
MIRVALVGATRVSGALAELIRGASDLSLSLFTDRATDDYLAQAAGPDGVAVLDLPEGESRELARALGARNVRVLDLGPDLRVPQVPCGFDESYAEDKRLVALPSPGAMAAACAAEELLREELIDRDRLVVTVVAGGGSSLRFDAGTQVADELAWMFEQRGGRRQRRFSVQVRNAGEGLLALAQGAGGRVESQDAAVLRKAQLYGPDWLRSVDAPDAARVAGTGVAEVSATVDVFCEWVIASCVIDPIAFPAHAALRAIRAIAS